MEKNHLALTKHCEQEIFYSEKNPTSPMASWFESYSAKTSSTNNCLEAFNKVYKDSYTFRHRMKVSDFCDVMLSSIESASEEKKRGENAFATITTISFEQWTAAYTFSKMKKTLRTLENSDGFKIFIFPSGSTLKICEKQYALFSNSSFKTCYTLTT